MTTRASLAACKDTTPFLVCVMLCYFLPLAPLDCGDGAQYITQYTVICLWLKFLLSFEAHSGSVLKWSSSSSKNWKPFHLRGLKGSKEHQITLPVVFRFFFFLLSEACNKLHLCRTRPLSGRGWGDCPRVQALETLSASKWGLLYFTLWP